MCRILDNSSVSDALLYYICVDNCLKYVGTENICEKVCANIRIEKIIDIIMIVKELKNTRELDSRLRLFLRESFCEESLRVSYQDFINNVLGKQCVVTPELIVEISTLCYVLFKKKLKGIPCSSKKFEVLMQKCIPFLLSSLFNFLNLICNEIITCISGERLQLIAFAIAARIISCLMYGKSIEVADSFEIAEAILRGCEIASKDVKMLNTFKKLCEILKDRNIYMSVLNSIVGVLERKGESTREGECA